MADIRIRSERVEDYEAVARVNALAFGNGWIEPSIVALQRQRSEYDPDLSLVAEIDWQVVGHAMFTARTMRLLGEDVRIVNLSPIAILPDFQRQGIGGRLVEEGHRVAAEKGYALSVLVGHPTYYPRFGYRTRAYGPAEVFVPRPETPAESLEMRPPGPDDVPALVSLWREDQAEVDFSIEPDVEFLAWVSPNPNITATVYLRDGEIVGYTRSHGAEANRLRYFLARDGETAQSMAATLVQGFTEGDTLLVPVHPASKAAQGLPEGTTTTWNAAMACELLPSRLDEYFTLVEEGKRPPGTVIWPVEFDLE